MNKRFQEILSLAQSGQIQRAHAKCERAIKKNPRDANYLLLAASLYAQDNNYMQIAEYCNRAAAIDPRNLSALYNLGVAYLELHDYENALATCKKALLIDNNNAKILSNLGLAQLKLGQIDEAIATSLSAIQQDPGVATAYNNLGLAYKSKKETESAIHYFKQAIKVNNSLAEAHYNCGITLLESGNDEGNQYINAALRISPEYPEANNYKGLKLLEDNKTAQAIAHFKKAISQKEDYAEAYCNIGNAFTTEKDFKTAESMYRKAIECDTEYASAYNNLGNVLLDQDDYRDNYAEAERCYLKAIKLAPELNDVYKNLAICYQGQGIHDKALHYFEQYNDRVPDDETVIAGMASVHERNGEFDEGMALIEPFVHNDEVSAEIILAYAGLAKHFKQEDKAIQALIDIDDSSMPNKLRIEKYYTLGKLSEPKGDIDTTFGYYKMANDLEEEGFDIAHEQNKFSNITSYFTKEKIKHLQRSTNTSTLPLFIVGMPRSGTSLAEQILASHPDVFGAGELENIHNIVKKIGNDLEPKNNYPLCLDNITSDYATQIANEHIETLQHMAPEARFIVDKMPHNFMGLGVINILFPKATVIHCKRSSVDTCLSIYFQHFNKHHSYSNSLKKLGQYYNLYADMMDHWNKTLDIKIIDLEYEKVIANPEDEMRNLLGESGIDWDPTCLKFHKTKRTVMTPSYDQVRRPIYTSSVAKWKNYERHLGDLINSLGDRAY